MSGMTNVVVTPVVNQPSGGEPVASSAASRMAPELRPIGGLPEGVSVKVATDLPLSQIKRADGTISLGLKDDSVDYKVEIRPASVGVGFSGEPKNLPAKLIFSGINQNPGENQSVIIDLLGGALKGVEIVRDPSDSKSVIVGVTSNRLPSPIGKESAGVITCTSLYRVSEDGGFKKLQ